MRRSAREARCPTGAGLLRSAACLRAVPTRSEECLHDGDERAASSDITINVLGARSKTWERRMQLQQGDKSGCSDTRDGRRLLRRRRSRLIHSGTHHLHGRVIRPDDRRDRCFRRGPPRQSAATARAEPRSSRAELDDDQAAVSKGWAVARMKRPDQGVNRRPHDPTRRSVAAIQATSWKRIRRGVYSSPVIFCSSLAPTFAHPAAGNSYRTQPRGFPTPTTSPWFPSLPTLPVVHSGRGWAIQQPRPRFGPTNHTRREP